MNYMLRNEPMNQTEHSLSTSALTVRESTPAARGTLLLLLLLSVITLPYQLGAAPRWQVLIAYSLPFPVVLLGVFVLILLRKCPPAKTTPAMLVSVAFILGGIAFDITATIIHSPDLAEESNPVARPLLDSGHSLTFVYAYGVLMQLLVALSMCILWIAFMRHRWIVADTSYQHGQQSFLHFFKAATGGSRLSWRQWLLPLSYADLPSCYYVVWALAPLVLGAAAYRWFLGLAWFGIVPHVSRLIVGMPLIVLSFLGYVGWLYVVYKQHRRSVAGTDN